MEQRVATIIHVLKKTYPNAHIALKYENNWELLVSVILSAQCTDKKVNSVTEVLFPKYRKLKVKNQKSKVQFKIQNEEQKEIANFATVPIAELEQYIRSTGFYHNKAKNIQTAARMLLEQFDGQLPKTMAEILKLPGVARKTANVVLGNAYGVVEGIAVDTHVNRLSQRLRLVDPDEVGPGKKPMKFERHDDLILDYYKDASPEKIEQSLMKTFPKNDWFKLTYLLIDHGRAICKAQRPSCQVCPLQKYCPASRV